RFDSFGFAEFVGIRLTTGGLRFKGMPGVLRVHFHRPIQGDIRQCTFRRDLKGWMVSFAVRVPAPQPCAGDRAIGVDLGITKFAVLSNGDTIPSLRAARSAERRLRIAQRGQSREKGFPRQSEGPEIVKAMPRPDWEAARQPSSPGNCPTHS